MHVTNGFSPSLGISPSSLQGFQHKLLWKVGRRRSLFSSSVSLSEIRDPSLFPANVIQSSNDQSAGNIIRSIPIDTANFKLIRETNQIYVDKTKIIFDHFVSHKGKRYHFLARPRRFGKSLVCSTIGELFMGNSELFQGLYINDKWDFKEEKRPVIHLDMRSLSMESPQNVMAELKTRLLDCARSYGVEYHLTEATPAQRALNDILHLLNEKYGKQAVVIIDEYDAPFHEFMSGTRKLQEEMTRSLSNFYGVLKSLDNQLRLVYITGILRFSQMSLFSKLNNLVDHTFNLGLSTICGYTEHELMKYFQRHLERLQLKFSHSTLDDTLSLLRSNYHGYHFGYDRWTETIGEGVFNPFEINRNLEATQLEDEWVLSGNSELLVNQIIRNANGRHILRDSEIPIEYLRSCDPLDGLPLPALEYFTGYSTIKAVNDNNTLTLGPPNKSIKDNISSMICMKLFQSNNYEKADMQSLLAAFRNNDASEVARLLHKLLLKISHQLWRNLSLKGDEESSKQEVEEKRKHVGAMKKKATNALGDNGAIYNLIVSLILQTATSIEDGWDFIDNEMSNMTSDMDCGVQFKDSNKKKKVWLLQYTLNKSPQVAIQQIQNKSFPVQFGDELVEAIIVDINFVRKKLRKKSNESSEFAVEVQMEVVEQKALL